MIRVLHCFGAMNIGGAETLIMNIYRKIDKSKIQFDFLVFSKDKGFFDDEIKLLGGKIYHLDSFGTLGPYKFKKGLMNFFKKEKIDCIHSHMDWQGGFIAEAAAKAGVERIIVHSHAVSGMYAGSIIKKIVMNRGKKLIRKYATDRLACSKDAGRDLFFEDKFEVLNNAINIQKFLNIDENKVREFKNQFGVKQEDFVKGHVGSFSENKNQEFLVEILDKIRDKRQNAKLLFIGRGNEYQKKVKKIVEQKQLDQSVIFAGVQTDIADLLQLMDVFVFPSITEGFGISIIEAQAAGVPCVISDTIPESVDMGLGLVNRESLDNADNWVSHILEHKQKIVDEECIKEKIQYNGFNLENLVVNIEQFYCNGL